MGDLHFSGKWVSSQFCKNPFVHWMEPFHLRTICGFDGIILRATHLPPTSSETWNSRALVGTKLARDFAVSAIMVRIIFGCCWHAQVICTKYRVPVNSEIWTGYDWTAPISMDVSLPVVRTSTGTCTYHLQLNLRTGLLRTILVIRKFDSTNENWKKREVNC